jgi:hypothetical protein
MTCSNCNGTGYIPCDQIAVQVGNTLVTANGVEECPECLAQGICPRCGLFRTAYATYPLPEGGLMEYPYCTACLWNERI